MDRSLLIRRRAIEFLLIGLGIAFASIGLKGFLLPNHFLDGGVLVSRPEVDRPLYLVGRVVVPELGKSGVCLSFHGPLFGLLEADRHRTAEHLDRLALQYLLAGPGISEDHEAVPRVRLARAGAPFASPLPGPGRSDIADIGFVDCPEPPESAGEV